MSIKTEIVRYHLTDRNLHKFKSTDTQLHDLGPRGGVVSSRLDPSPGPRRVSTRILREKW